MDCVWRDSCQSFKKVNEMRDMRDNPGRPNTVFEAIIVNCSIKNIDRSYKGDNNGMYYCSGCGAMHHEWSRIGKLHKKIP